MSSKVGRQIQQRRYGVHRRWGLLYYLCASSILYACGSNLPSEPTPPPKFNTPTALATAEPSPTANLDLEFVEEYWIHPPHGSMLELVGIMKNSGEKSLEEIKITLALDPHDGTGIETFTTASTPSTLEPNAEAMFHFKLSGREVPEDYSLTFSSIETETLPPAKVEIEVLASRQHADGGVVILAQAYNGTDHLLHLKQVEILLLDQNGEPVEIATSTHLLPALAPGDSNPFIAYSHTGSMSHHWRAFIEASPALLPSPPPLTVELTPKLEQTAQGHPFYIAQIENQGVTAWWVEAIVLYSVEGEPVGLDTFRLPVPVPPKDRVPLLIEPLRALPASLIAQGNRGEIQIQFLLDPWASIPVLAKPLPMPVSITQFEQIGSRLYIQGQIHNPHNTRMVQSGILTRILDLRGNVRSTGWNDPLEDLEPGQTLSFTSSMPLPKDLELNLVEFDIQAYGFSAEG